jgi:hypothetical protein
MAREYHGGLLRRPFRLGPLTIVILEACAELARGELFRACQRCRRRAVEERRQIGRL